MISLPGDKCNPLSYPDGGGEEEVDNSWGECSVFIIAWGHDHIKTKYSSVLL